MKLHANASDLSEQPRADLLGGCSSEGWTLGAAARPPGCSERTARKWVARYRDGDRRLLDRSSAPEADPSSGSRRSACEAIEALRRLRMTAAEIAEILAHAALDRLAAG